MHFSILSIHCCSHLDSHLVSNFYINGYHNAYLYVYANKYSYSNPISYPLRGGGYILYTVSESGSKSADIVIKSSDGKDDPQSLLPDITWQTSATWSPDGSRIAVVSDRGYGGGGDLYVTSIDGSYLKLTSISSNEYSWSPTGNQIAVTRSGKDYYWAIFVIDTNGENLEQLTDIDEGFLQYSPDWSPDGTQIAFVKYNRKVDSEIFIVSVGDKSIRQLTDNEVTDGSPKWSPDGKQIVFLSAQAMHSELYVIDQDGNNLRNLSNHEADDMCFVWSPDGKHILFVSDRDSNAEIYIVDTDGNNLRNLTNNEADDGTHGCSLDWSPDGKQIVFASDRSNHIPLASGIYIMNVDGSNVHPLIEGNGQRGFFSPKWQPSP